MWLFFRRVIDDAHDQVHHAGLHGGKEFIFGHGMDLKVADRYQQHRKTETGTIGMDVHP